MSSSTCKITYPVCEADWLDHLSRVGSYSFFQTPLWCRALCAFDSRYRDSTVLLEFDGEQVLFPCIAVRRRFGLETLESMPWGTYGGLIASRTLRADEEKQCLEAILSIRCPQLLVVSWPGTELSCKSSRVQHQETHRLDLREGFDSIWNHRYASRHRTKIRKAKRNGLEVAIDNSADGIARYKRLYEASMRRWEGDLAFDPAFLDQWIDAPEKHVSFWFCGRSDEAMAAAIVFYSPTEAHYWSGASDLQYSKRNPSNLLLSRTIEDAIRRGCRTYNFASSAGLPGVIQFKKQFGPDPVPYYRYVFTQWAWRPLEWIRRGIRR